MWPQSGYPSNIEKHRVKQIHRKDILFYLPVKQLSLHYFHDFTGIAWLAPQLIPKKALVNISSSNTMWRFQTLPCSGPPSAGTTSLWTNRLTHPYLHLLPKKWPKNSCPSDGFLGKSISRWAFDMWPIYYFFKIKLNYYKMWSNQLILEIKYAKRILIFDRSTSWLKHHASDIPTISYSKHTIKERDWACKDQLTFNSHAPSHTCAYPG